MTSLLGAKKRAEEFATAVDRTAEQTDLPPDLAELVGVVSALRAHQVPQPRAEFSAALRERLLAEAETTLAQDRALTLPARRHGTRERRLALLASSFVLVGGTAGMAAAAQNSLPGDALYPIKRGLEKAQADLSTSQTSKGRDLLGQADARLDEVRGLLDGSSDVHQLPATIDDFTASAVEGSDLLLAAYDQSHDPALVADVRDFTSNGIAALQEAAKTAPSEHQDELTEAAMKLVEIDKRAADACPSCAESKPTLQMPPVFLTAAEADRALDAVQRVRMDNSHPALSEGTPAKPKGGTGGDQPVGQQPDTPDLPGGSVGSEPPPDGKDLPGKVEAGTGDVLGKAGDAGKDAKDALPDELDSLVNTLLP